MRGAWSMAPLSQFNCCFFPPPISPFVSPSVRPSVCVFLFWFFASVRFSYFSLVLVFLLTSVLTGITRTSLISPLCPALFFIIFPHSASIIPAHSPHIWLLRSGYYVYYLIISDWSYWSPVFLLRYVLLIQVRSKWLGLDPFGSNQSDMLCLSFLWTFSFLMK